MFTAINHMKTLDEFQPGGGLDVAKVGKQTIYLP